ncbi:Mannose-6-phosphate isomerase [Commensalibacter communis]|uniref:mannose-1-phosphate guanylyltransferase n=1 Tax=Commensalibacter communis TaxID=2972786 RepID=A0A9W4TMJ4_9PROT|nr:mannose-1-phosphate guanylyltransferase/mannose-6-phosphate isomerase [Commensalibacter communis]CAI3922453.1 Mannose-6-phosphate isomerase [Commensalibacter communis]CAI3923724.1 Mannose-6-phosphate isomerase [Commensalibacter communis]CAI3931012.1 Mannose-6-phosphate isomerase [Commensalibacter communis]CAI3938703.1 Mannose-6-phosphate isomerase [Commensalibacter communis]CAI3939278.1 Mannose-6-phosphate isomerase [Commensalibacter communis]
MSGTEMIKIVPVILSGGTGSRLWPVSRASFPKQLWPLLSENSMLQDTALRAIGSLFTDPIIVCNNDHRFLIAEQLREIGIEKARILLEPIGKNSAPAIAAASLLVEEENPHYILWVMAADAVVQETERLIQLVEEAASLAKQGNIITFGIQPTRPETGYGYIQKGDKVSDAQHAFSVKAFTEKPDFQRASQMVESGQYLWNSGMFVFSAQTMLQEMGKYTPELLSSIQTAIQQRKTDLFFERIQLEDFEKVPDISIDYAIAEKTEKMLVIAADLTWSDIGSWDGLWDISAKDEVGNVAIGNVVLENTQNSYIRSDDMVAAVNGLENIVVVVTKDAVLVTDRRKSQDVKRIVEKLILANQKEAFAHTRCYRPWGYYETLASGHRFQVKQLVVNEGAQLSLQKHYHRSEHWVVVSGVAEVTRDTEIILVKENESIYLPVGTLHRLKNPGRIPLVVIEIQSGSYLNEDDIVRLEDNYNRLD